MKCTQCDFQNDSTRVFCQNCGTRLPVSTTPPAGKLFIPPEQQASKDVRKPIKPVRVPVSPSIRRNAGRRLVRSLVFTIIFAAFLAAVIQMLRTPDSIPLPQISNDGAASTFYQTAKSAAADQSPRALQMTQSQVNNYLATTVLTAPDDNGAGIRARFSRAFVVFGNGNYRFFIEQKVLNWPIYIYLVQQPVFVDKNMTVKITGGGIGRMPFDPHLLAMVGHFINPVTGALTEATDLLQKASGVTITPTQATVSWPGTAPAPR